MSLRLAIAFLMLDIAAAAAQPAPCDECTRGDTVIEQFSLQPLRALAVELAAVPLDYPATAKQYERVIEIRSKTPALSRVGALDDEQLGLVAAALCHNVDDACAVSTRHTLSCLADRCAVELPKAAHVDIVVVPEPCARGGRERRSPKFGLGLDWGTGVHDSRYPNDGRVWSMGIEGRLQATRRIGAVARVDRESGRDQALDMDGNGKGDMTTGSVIRVSALAGPSFVIGNTQFEGSVRFLRLDVLGGYLLTRSPNGEDGPVAGADLSYQFWAIRTGVRVVQGFADASDARMVIAHLGFVSGSRPELRDDSPCDINGQPKTNFLSSRLALGLDYTFGGYGFDNDLGYLATGVGLEAMWHLSASFDAVVRGDLNIFPGKDRDRTLHQAVLGGLRIDPPRRPGRSSRTGWFGEALAGYTHAAGLEPSSAGTGPLIDAALGWGAQGRDGAAYFKFHGRFGIGDDNTDYRAFFISGGFEYRYDRYRGRHRFQLPPARAGESEAQSDEEAARLHASEEEADEGEPRDHQEARCDLPRAAGCGGATRVGRADLARARQDLRAIRRPPSRRRPHRGMAARARRRSAGVGRGRPRPVLSAAVRGPQGLDRRHPRHEARLGHGREPRRASARHDRRQTPLISCSHRRWVPSLDHGPSRHRRPRSVRRVWRPRR
jgi:hypothetical protein